MGIFRYKGSKVWTMKFMFQGVSIRESTGTRNKELAGRIERDRRLALEEGAAGIKRPEKAKLFSVAADEWLNFKELDIEPKTLGIHKNSLQHLLPIFGKSLLTAITPEDIKEFQKERLRAGAAKKSVNLDVETLRGIFIHYSQWDRVKSKVKMLRLSEDEQIGKALDADEQAALLEGCSMSRSRVLYFMAVLALETGARYSTIKNLKWRYVDFADRSLRWGKDKTPSGSGRVVPLNQRAMAALKWWEAEFPNRKTDHYVFPSEQYSASGNRFGTTGSETATVIHATDSTKPIGSVKTSWRTAKEYAGWVLAGKPESREGVEPLVCRFHDLRHTAASRMLKAKIPITTVAKIMGWSASTMVLMAKRYSHYMVDDLREAMETTSVPPQVPCGTESTDGRIKFTTTELAEVQRLHVQEKLSKTDIAKEFGISRYSVARMLEKTRSYTAKNTAYPNRKKLFSNAAKGTQQNQRIS